MPYRPLAFGSLAILALAACDVDERGQFTTTPGSNPETAAPPVAATQVQLFPGRPDRAFAEVGPVKVTVNKLTAFHPNPTEEDVRAALREKAGALGADAVIDAEITGIHVAPLSWGARTGKGVAVTFQDADGA